MSRERIPRRGSHGIRLRCGECNAPMVLRSGRFGLFWSCSEFPRCRGAHGAHADGRPLGTPADRETKQARMRAHAVFDQLWQKPRMLMPRSAAYVVLRRIMRLSKRKAHISKLDKRQCEELIARLGEEYGLAEW